MIVDTLLNYVYDEQRIGVSDFNMYRPYFTLNFSHWLIGGAEYYYNIDFLRASFSSKVNIYKRVINTLIYGSCVVFEKTNSLILPGTIFDLHSQAPLLMLSYKNLPTQHQLETQTSVDPFNSSGTPKFKEFLLYINKDLTDLEKHKNLWNRLQKEYLPYFKKENVPIMITSGERIMSDNFDDGLNYNERIKTIMDIPILIEEVKQLLPLPILEVNENTDTLENVGIPVVRSPDDFN